MLNPRKAAWPKTMVSPQRHVSRPRKRNSVVVTHKHKHEKRKEEEGRRSGRVQWQSPASQAIWFSGLLDSAPGAGLSELEGSPCLSGESFIEVGSERDPSNISKHVKSMLKGAGLFEGEGGADKEKGNPALLVLCSSATRCLELLKGLRCLTNLCKPAKLFAKHIKVEEQMKALKDYVNIAVGTPNRVRKLMDVGALGLGSLEVVLFDMHEDAKGFTLFTVPQVKADLLELCRVHFYDHVLTGKIKFCLY